MRKALRIQGLSRWVLGIFFVVAGVNHFLSPGFYQSIVPPFLPWPMALVYISGVAEILGGVGVFVSWSRRVAGWGLIALLIAVFPANIYAVIRDPNASTLLRILLLARLPFQGVLIAWVYRACLSGAPHRRRSQEKDEKERVDQERIESLPSK